MTLKMKQKSDVGFSTLPNVDTTSVPDVETTLQQRYTTLFQPSVDIIVKTILNPVRLVMIMDLQIHE